MNAPTFATLKRTLLQSGYEIRNFPSHTLERLALDSPTEVKRHTESQIMGLIMPDEGVIGIASELPADAKALTLVHETLHLWKEDLPEDEVEALTQELELKLTPAELGFFEFLAS
jgi:hypothetical protein